MSAAPITLTDILGETREIVFTWPDGSFQCPFCGYASRDGVCDNPACSASHWATPGNRHHFQEMKDRTERERAESAERRRNHEIAMRRIEEDNRARGQRRAEFIARVREAGGCLLCSDEYHDKVRRHRKGCPKDRHP
jgi:hypothetical protein